jgi:HPt (histidine-containing phosphotransfer) domain-containing protein
MNAFLTKPLQAERLQEILEHFAMGDTLLVPASASPASAASTPVDLVLLNELTAGDHEFALELTSTFIASGEEVMLEVIAALTAADSHGLSRAAHKLKGAGANIHAEGLRSLAHGLEVQAPQLAPPQLAEQVAQLRAEFDRVAQFLTRQYSGSLPLACGA